MADMTEVRVGSIWADNDKRSTGRRVRIVEIVHRHVGGNGAHLPRGVPHAVVEQVYFTGHSHEPFARSRRTTIRLDRFRPTASGYRLVENAAGEPC